MLSLIIIIIILLDLNNTLYFIFPISIAKGLFLSDLYLIMNESFKFKARAAIINPAYYIKNFPVSNS